MATHDTLRKAAILINCLEADEARAMLRQMSAPQREALRAAQRELGPVSQQEQLAVLEEFFRVGPIHSVPVDSGIELDGSLARKLAMPQQPRDVDLSPLSRRTESSAPVPFQKIQSARGRDLAAAVAAEHPQTIAAIVSHLRPDQGAELLAELPGSMQADVARRLVDLEELHPDVLAELERGIESFLATNRGFQSKRAAGWAALDSILARADGQTRRKIMDNLASHDRQLARQMRTEPTGNSTSRHLQSGRSLSFSELGSLDDESLLKVLHTVETEVMVLALVGANADFVERILRQLPFDEARALKYALAHLPPTRLSDLEEAQAILAEQAQQLLDTSERQSQTRHPISVAV